MVQSMFFLVAGIWVGWFLRNKPRILRINSGLTNAVVFMLLFFMGISVGINEQVVTSFGQIGIQSIGLTLFAMAGSILTTFILVRLFMQQK